MNRVHKDNFVPRYKTGKWLWDDVTEKFAFLPKDGAAEASRKESHYAERMDQVEELIFRQEFSRAETSHDAEVVTLQDVKNLVLFLAPAGVMQRSFVDFVHTATVDKLLKALIIYFEYFLKVLEFLLIRRDEVTGKVPQMQSLASVQVKQMLSERLSQYRLLVAREYSKVLLGDAELDRFYHLNTVVNISSTTSDRVLHEGFIAFAVEVVWVAMHRKARDLITHETNRLLRSDHFTRRAAKQRPLWPVEQQVLYGRNYRRQNYRAQVSPLVQEIAHVSPKNLPILWIGERKYRGTDERIHQLELEFVVPSSQLCLIDVAHGILGHPKRLYNTLLSLDWEQVRFEGYSAQYDPYKIVRQPYLDVPKWSQFNATHASLEPFYEIKDTSQERDPRLLWKWKHRDAVVAFFKSEGILSDAVLECQRECRRMAAELRVSRERIFKEFAARMAKLRKK